MRGKGVNAFNSVVVCEHASEGGDVVRLLVGLLIFSELQLVPCIETRRVKLHELSRAKPGMLDPRARSSLTLLVGRQKITSR